MSEAAPYWQTKTLEELDPDEWEALCDGCGRCCLNKLEDWDTARIHWTNVACSLLDHASCSCTNYPNRAALVPDCVTLTAEIVRTASWLPPTCAYRLLAQGRPLYWWHPLISGDPQTVHEAGISVRGRVLSEDDVPLENYEDHLASWPGRVPKQARRARRASPPGRRR